MPGGSPARTLASCSSASRTWGLSGPPALMKTRAPSTQCTMPAYEPVKPDVTTGSALRTSLPARRPTSERTSAGSAVHPGRRDVNR